MSQPIRKPGDGNQGPDAVRAALISAAAEALADAGPSSVSVRDVARQAGVNHGQVHHYFGGKRGLLRAAMHKLASEHFDYVSEHYAEGSDYPRPLESLLADRAYWRAVCQCVMEGDMELARVEVDENVSVPRSALRRTMATHGIGDDDLDFKVRFGAMMALNLGWVAMEDFIMLVAEIDPKHREETRERVKDFAEQWIAAMIEAHDDGTKD